MTELERLDAGLEHDFLDAGVPARVVRAIDDDVDTRGTAR